MSVFKSAYNWFQDMAVAMAREFNAVFHDMGVMIFFFMLPLMYPLVYTLIYNPEIVTDMPVVIVDQSQTVASRDLIRRIDATQSMKVLTQSADFSEARDLFDRHEVNAIFVIPQDYSRKIGRMEQATVSVYCDMSLLLRYRAILLSLSDVQLNLISDITADRSASLGMSSDGSVMPVRVNDHFTGDPTQGFASFVIPGIVILILQQSMLLGICMLGGTRRERRHNTLRRVDMLFTPPGYRLSLTATVIGRALCYFFCYLPLTLYIVHWVPAIFSLPQYGNLTDIVPFIAPLLLATAFLGQFLTYFVRERETGFVLVVFSSVVLLFLSGLTWPRYAMPSYWQWIADIVPSTWGVEGFIRINNNGATLAEVSRPYAMMWLLTAVYFLCAIITARRDRKATFQSPI